MAADIFAKIGDIKGESLDNKHKDEIEVLSYSWGLSNSGSMGTGSGGGEGKANLQDITFVHYLDKASPVLMLHCSTGHHMPNATITSRKAGKEQQEYLVIKLDEVLVTSVSHGNGGGDGRPTESVTLSFAKIHLEYKPQGKDGALLPGIHYKYDQQLNKTF